MAERVIIPAARRTILGKQVKRLRREGRLPANVFGRGLESVAIDIDSREFMRTVRSVGIRGMFELNIDGENDPRYVVVRALSRYGGTGDPLHVDFYQVDPNRPINQIVPLRLVGEAPAVRDLAGTLVQSLDLVSVHCLPLDIPEAIEADVSMLVSFEATLTVGDLTPPAGVEILTDPSVPVASVAAPRLRLEEEEEEEGEEAAAAAEEGEPAAAAE